MNAVRALTFWSGAFLKRFFTRKQPLRHGLIQAARHAPRLLGDSTTLVRQFILSRRNSDGGFRGRSPNSDLYYTLFGLQGLLALQALSPEEFAPSAAYIQAFGDGASLDFVHLCCLARCRALLRDAGIPLDCPLGAHLKEAMRKHLEGHRTPDGGYNLLPGQPNGTTYAAFLALGAYDDLQAPLPSPGKLARSLHPLKIAKGGWLNERHAKIASTNSTAAAVGLLANLGHLTNYPQAGQWILAQTHPQGGFRASPLAPIPDLLSTATALHTLAGIGISVAPIRESCLDFIDSLWSNEGGFHGHWDDDLLDVEYTFYGLLALGNLSAK